MRADRLVNIMILLQSRGKMTAKELSAELEVTVRTIIRDMDALGNAGIPIVSERGREGGWRLVDNFRSRLSGLNKADMSALFVFPAEELLEDLGLNQQGIDTRQKLLATVPIAYRHEAQAMWERIHIDSGTWGPAKEKDKTGTLVMVQQAIWEDRKLTIRYQQADGKVSERTIEPLGLVAKGNKWYLVAVRDGELRNYRVSRIQQVEIEDATFKRPDGFNLPSYWKQSKKEFVKELPRYDVHVEVHPEILNRINFTGKFVKVIKAENLSEGEWISMTLQFNDEQEAVEFILGFANKIKVISPEAIAAKVVSSALSVIDFYKRKS